MKLFFLLLFLTPSFAFAGLSVPSSSASPLSPTQVFDGTNVVTISHPDPTAKIYYTTNGSTPTGASTLYTAPVTLSNGTTTVKSIAYVAPTSAPQSNAFTAYIYQAETTAWVANVASAGGAAIPLATKNAVDVFIVSAKSRGYWNNLLDVGPMAGADLASALVKIKTYSGSGSSLTNTSFVSGDYTSAGLTGGSGKKLNTNVDYAAVGKMLGVSFFSTRDNVNTGGQQMVGNNFTAPGVHMGVADGTAMQNINGPFGGNNDYVANKLTPLGFYHFYRSTTTLAQTRINGVFTRSNTATVDTSTRSENICLFSTTSGGNYYLGTGGFYAIDDGQMTDTQATNFAADVVTLQASLGRLARSSNPLKFAIVTGQSLSVGATGTPILSTVASTLNKNRIFGGITTGNSATGTATGDITVTFMAPVSKYTANLTPQIEASVAETGWTVFAAKVSADQRTAVSGDDSQDLVISNFGLPGTAYSGLKKTTAIYAAAIAAVTNLKANYPLYSSAGYSVPGIIVVHGENDLFSATYQTDIETWQSDYETDIKTITGQSGTIPMFHSQPSSWTQSPNYSQATSTTPYAMLAAYEANPTKSVLVCPKYFFTYGSDGLHFTNTSYQRLGEYYAKAWTAVVVNGGTWSPLRPSSVVRSGAVITVSFAGAVGNLNLDTTNVSNPGNNGFEWSQTGGTARTISSVALINSNTQIQITLSGDPGTPTTQRLRYAYTGIAGANAGPTTGPRGNLRDSDTAIGNTTGTNLYNWCVHFDKTVN